MENKKTLKFLNNMIENCVDAVIISKTSTKEEIFERYKNFYNRN